MRDPFDEESPGIWAWLQAWYAAQCDGDWEHSFGIEIGTLDNPGWQVKIDLEGTDAPDDPYQRREVHRSEHDWCVTWVEDSKYQAACGPLNLGEALHEFRLWTEVGKK